MDIRIINGEDEIINVSRLSIRTENRYLVGMNERGERIIIEGYKNWIEAREKLMDIVGEIKEIGKKGNDIIIDLREEKK